MLAAAAHTVAVLIEAAGSALLVGFVLAAGGALLRGGGGLERARLLVAEGAVLALNFKTGATLLKTLDLPTWDRIAAFAAILALRTALKRAFAAERAALAAAAGPTGWTGNDQAGRPGQRRPGSGLRAWMSAHLRTRATPRANSADLQ